jgi:hypothetical protein
MLFGHYSRYWLDKHEMMVPKLELESVHALHIEGHCAHLSEKL